MDRIELSAALHTASHLTGSFVLRSGRTATEYFDKYGFESDPLLLAAVAEHFTPLIPGGTELLAGLELGGVPIATALALRTGRPAVFVRKEAKAYGTRRLAEGAEIGGGGCWWSRTSSRPVGRSSSRRPTSGSEERSSPTPSAWSIARRAAVRRSPRRACGCTRCSPLGSW